jgi:tRNA(Ile)-lysidine synthase
MVLALKSNRVVPASISNALSRYCNPDARVAVCVSGGVDSMTLMHASVTQPAELSVRHITSAKDLATNAPYKPLVITVDHQLRIESSREAEFVRESAERVGLDCLKLKLDWHGEALTSNRIMEAARAKRYRAISDACLSNGVDCLMTAHHQGMLSGLIIFPG